VSYDFEPTFIFPRLFPNKVPLSATKRVVQELLAIPLAESLPIPTDAAPVSCLAGAAAIFCTNPFPIPHTFSPKPLIIPSPFSHHFFPRSVPIDSILIINIAFIIKIDIVTSNGSKFSLLIPAAAIPCPEFTKPDFKIIILIQIKNK
jgi:hypothetical protein